MRALLCFRVTINVQIKWEKCLFTEIPIGGLWPGKGWGRPWGQGLWPWHSGDTARPAWPSSQPVSINCNNNGHWTQAARGRDRQIQLMYNLALQNTTPAITQTGSVSSACSLRCAHFRVCQYSLAANSQIWVEERGWHQGALTALWAWCQPARAARSGQIIWVVNHTSYQYQSPLSLEGWACDLRSLCGCSHRYLTQAPPGPNTLRDQSKLVDSLQIEKVQLNWDPNGPAY